MGQQTANRQGPLAEHGGVNLPSLEVKSYNLENRDEEGFIGDRASSGAFSELLDQWRERLREAGDDPLGDTPTEEISKEQLDDLLTTGEPEAAAVIQTAVEDFAKRLADVLRRFLRLKTWRGTERVAIGGGFRNHRVGELAIGRAAVILKSEGVEIDLQPIRYHPDEAGLVGCGHLAPSWLFTGFDGILAVDIGGSNVRCGAVQLNLKKAPDLSRAKVVDVRLWRHAEDEPGRDEVVSELISMLERSIAAAKRKKLRLAPFIGIGCPGIINPDGSIERGAQNLPGKWEAGNFNLPQVLKERLPKIGGHETTIIMHNDAVVQGLSETLFMQDVEHWGILTIGTGLGNASFANRG